MIRRCYAGEEEAYDVENPIYDGVEVIYVGKEEIFVSVFVAPLREKFSLSFTEREMQR